MKKWGVILFICMASIVMQAQGDQQGPNILYFHQRYVGLQLNTNGYGAFYVYGKNKDAFQIRQFTADFAIYRHEKERKYFFPEQNAKGYYYGKQNSFFAFKAGVGKRKIITEKLRKNGVMISYTLQSGGILGFLKPVYLQIIHQYEDSPGSYYLEIERYDPSQHYIDNIYGRASFLRGFGDLKIVPGVYVRGAWNFEFANYREGLKGLEIGASLDAFPFRVPIMAQSILDEKSNGAKNHQFFATVYLNFFIGRKYNRE